MKRRYRHCRNFENKLEQDQRDRRKQLETAGEEHIPKFFKLKGNGPVDEAEWEFIQGEKVIGIEERKVTGMI